MTHCAIDPFLAQVSSEDGLGMVLRGVFLRPPRRGVPTPDPDPMGSLRGLAPSCTRRRVLSENRAAAVSEGCRGVPCHVLSVAKV